MKIDEASFKSFVNDLIRHDDRPGFTLSTGFDRHCFGWNVVLTNDRHSVRMMVGFRALRMALNGIYKVRWEIEKQIDLAFKLLAIPCAQNATVIGSEWVTWHADDGTECAPPEGWNDQASGVTSVTGSFTDD